MSTACWRHPGGWVAGRNPSSVIWSARAWSAGLSESVRSVSSARAWVRVSVAAAC
ncbi:hypothetical protein Ae717Ps2_6467 [Pseudonocardia sp. Ae717_Ps2]|nr:hypothetical protein Ae717Ps2_6467 [Pseudonocardia sp. Ae717_Ps2]